MNNNNRLRGITLVEIFVALGVLAIALTFAAVPLERMSARADVDIARENIVYAMKSAHRAAIRANIPVRMFISPDGADNRLEAGFSPRRGTVDFNYLPNYRLPEHVSVAFPEGISRIDFLPSGQVNPAGFITLSSSNHPDYVVTITIDNAVTPRAPASL